MQENIPWYWEYQGIPNNNDMNRQHNVKKFETIFKSQVTKFKQS